MQISEWLEQLGLERYVPVFEENEVDIEVLPELTEKDLETLGLPLGPRKKIIKKITSEAFCPAEPVLENAKPLQLNEAERRQLTVMFVDLVGSTPLSGQLDPEDMRDVIRSFQNAVVGEIARFEGHVAKYLGDGVLAYFGWPSAHEDESERAIRAGLAVTQQIAKLITPTGEFLSARVGIATGQVLVGDLYGQEEGSVVGDTPNLAARLQQIAPIGGVVVAERTKRLVGNLFEVEDLGLEPIKGFSNPQRIFRITGESQVESRFEAMHGKRLTPLVGRKHELEMLLDRFQRASDGDGQVVALIGEAGIGKSRILKAVREQLTYTDYITVSHYCSPYHVNSAFFPIIGLLERAADFKDSDTNATKLEKIEALVSVGRERIEEAVPLLAALLSVSCRDKYPQMDLTPQRRKERTFDVLVDQVRGLAKKQPVLAVYEDLQWADPTTLEAIGILISSLQELPVMVLLTARPDFTLPWQGHAHVMQMSLTRLSRSHGERIIERITGGKPLPQEVLDMILARTDGVPLFVEEMTKTVLETGVLCETGSGFELAGTLPPLAVPSSLSDSLMARLDRMAPVREIAQIAAVIGRNFSYNLLAAVSDLPEQQLLAALEKLAIAELIFRRGAPPDATYSFKHALVQDAAYQTLLLSRRRQIHAKIADILSGDPAHVGAGEADMLAHHYTEADMPVDAVNCWLKAGHLALGQSATSEAINHFAIGIKVSKQVPDEEHRLRYELDLQLAIASAYVASRGIAAPEVGIAYLRAKELCHQLGETKQWFAIRYGQCIFHLYRAEMEASKESAEDLLLEAKKHDDNDLRFFALRAMGVAALPRGDFVSVRENLEKALTLYDRERHLTPASIYAFDPQVICLDYLSRAHLALGSLDKAVDCHKKALREARQRNHQNTIALPLFFGAVIYQLMSDNNAVRERVEELVDLAAKQGLRLWSAGGAILSGWLSAQNGDARNGARQIEEGITAWQSTGAQCFVPYFRSCLSDAYAAAGSLDLAMQQIDAALALTASTGERWLEAELHRQKACIMMQQGSAKSVEVEARLKKAIEVSRNQRARFWELKSARTLGEWLIGCGQPDEASQVLQAVSSIGRGGRVVSEDARTVRNLLADLNCAAPQAEIRAPTH